MEEQQNHQDKNQSQKPLDSSDCGCKKGNPLVSKVQKDDLMIRMEMLEQLKKQLSELGKVDDSKESRQNVKAQMETLLKLPSEDQIPLAVRSASEPNEMTPDGNQEQEVGILAAVPCCANGCILTDAANECSVAEGTGTTASGGASHAEGNGTTASGIASHAEGIGTLANQTAAHAEGIGNTASGRAAHAEGGSAFLSGNLPNTASGDSSHAEGLNTTASKTAAHAEGEGTTASGFSSHAEGNGTTASGPQSHAEGAGNTASGPQSHAEGANTRASGFASHAEGFFNEASGSGSHAEGEAILVNGFPQPTLAIGNGSHAEGQSTTANGEASHTEGRQTKTNALAAHAEGQGTTASGIASHAEGGGTTASGDRSHAEGTSTTASGGASHAEGNNTTASGIASHAEGGGTTASGNHSHAEGSGTIADASFSHAEGNSTSTGGLNGVHIMGRFGDANDLTFSWYLANGTSPTNKGIAAKILRTGAAFADVGWFGGGADYAEMFETVDGNPIDVGYFVTLDGDGDKIRKANDQDNYVLGITSANPVVLGDSAEMRWEKKFLTDEWGRVLYHDVVIPPVKDEEGNIIEPEHTESEPIINPEWDPTKEYIPRLKRPEWIAVGMLGKLLVRDDGTCQPKGYCRPNDEGIASASNKGYRVMKRTGPNQILVLFK